MLTLACRFHVINANSIRGRRILYITATKLVVTNDSFTPAASYKLHELETALECAAWTCACSCIPSSAVCRALLPAIISTLVHRVGAFAYHLRALELQDLLPAIVHYYLRYLPTVPTCGN